MAYFTRSRALAEHKAAGVLPFCLYEDAVLVLLGAEPCRTGPGGKLYRTMWRDFGGSREAQDSDSAATAAREFAEETLGLFGACGVDAASVALAAATFEARLRDPGQALKVVYTLKKGSYHFFMTQTPFVAPLMFRLASEQNAATGGVPGGEKSAFAWVPLRAVLECVAATAPRYFLEAPAHVCGGEGTPPPAKCGLRRFQLHPCFANSLRQAQRCGLQELLARAKDLPLLPPPPPLPSLLLQPAAEPAGSVLGAAGNGPGGSAAVDSGSAAVAAVEQATTVAAEQAAAAVEVTAAAVEVAAAAAEVAAAAAEVAVAAAVGGASDSAGTSADEEEEAGPPFGSSLLDHSLGHWLAQAEIAAALESSGFAIPAAGAASLPAGLLLPLVPEQLLPLPEQQGGKKRRRRQRQRQAPGQAETAGGQQEEEQAAATPAAAVEGPARGAAAAESERAAAGAAAAGAAAVEAAGHRAGACMPPASAATSSQARPASSVDTASSLRQSRQAAAAAAVGEVVSQIQHNSQQPHKHRLSRKQRLKRRQQRQREAAGGAAAAAAAAAAAEPGGGGPGAPAAANPAVVSPPASPAVVPPPAHWTHAAAELQAEFQPRLRHSKRLRLQVAA